MEKVQADQASFEAHIGLPPFRVIESVQQKAIEYLELSPQEQRKLTPDDAAEACVVLAQYAAHVGRAVQRQEAMMSWADAEILKVLTDDMQQTRGYGLAEKRLLALRHNHHAQQLEEVRAKAEFRYKSLVFLAQRIEKVAESYKNVSNRQKRNNQFGS